MRPVNTGIASQISRGGTQQGDVFVETLIEAGALVVKPADRHDRPRFIDLSTGINKRMFPRGSRRKAKAITTFVRATDQPVDAERHKRIGSNAGTQFRRDRPHIVSCEKLFPVAMALCTKVGAHHRIEHGGAITTGKTKRATESRGRLTKLICAFGLRPLTNPAVIAVFAQTVRIMLHAEAITAFAAKLLLFTHFVHIHRHHTPTT